MIADTVLVADHVLTGPGARAFPGAVAVAGGRIAGCGPADEIARLHPGAARVELGDAVLMPGLINAHQHGRGLSQIQLGYPDDALEPWIAARRGRGAPDARALTRLAALQMISNGVTATLHANYSYGTGDYEAELRGVIRAYEETGMRATVCVGFADRGGLVYPPADEAAFLRGLPAAARALVAAARPAYLASVEATIALMHRLRADHAGHPTVTLAYGPAGPQWVSDEAWRALARDAAQHGIGMHFHLLESPAQAEAARRLYPGGAVERLAALGVLEARASAAHFAQAREADMTAAARHGLVIVTNPGANMRLYNGPPPVAAMRRAGITLAVGTDNCALADDEDFLRELRLAALLGREPGIGGEGPSAAEQIAMATANGARAIFLEGPHALVPGARADMVAVGLARARGAWLDPDMDAVEAMLARAGGADVTLTMVAGRILYRDGRLLAGDMGAARVAAAGTASASRPAGEVTAAVVAGLQAALRDHYRGRS